jgi:hypothetical protein
MLLLETHDTLAGLHKLLLPLLTDMFNNPLVAVFLLMNIYLVIHFVYNVCLFSLHTKI